MVHTDMVRSLHDFVLAFGSNCSGVYPDMQSARAAAPRNRVFGYDNREAAELYLGCQEPSWGDHAMVCWLQQIISPATTLLDIGGNFGQLFYVFARYLRYPESFRWVVFDLPAEVEAGRRIKSQHPQPQLEFVTSMDACCSPQIVLASGVLQYLDWSLAAWLESCRVRPGHVLINKLPAYDGSQYVTLQDIGPSPVAYHVFNRQEFLASMLKSGYELCDRWSIGELQCRIPFHPSRSVEAYSGMYFRLKADARA